MEGRTVHMLYTQASPTPCSSLCDACNGGTLKELTLVIGSGVLSQVAGFSSYLTSWSSGIQ